MTTNKDNRLAIRVRDGEKERLQTVVARVCERNPHMDMTKVMRELIGFDERRFVTDDDIYYLRTGKDKNLEAEETNRKTNSAFKVLRPEPTIRDVAALLAQQTGLKITPVEVSLYHLHTQGIDESFLDLPEEIKGTIISYYSEQEEKTG